VGLETAVWRALAVFRTLGLLYAVAVYVRRYDEYAHPAGGWAVLGLMAGWTVLTAIAYGRPSLRRWPLASADLAVAMVTVVATRFLDDADRIADGAQTLPVVWAATPVLVFAVLGGWPAGVAAAAGVGLADLVHRGELTVPTANNIVLLLLAGAVVGYTMSLARRGEAALSRALALQAAAAERERLSRDIHDNVLQVLALVGRRGLEAGGEAAEIGRLAADQERALRALVTAAPGTSGGELDLRTLLTAYATATVTVSTPATPVLLAAARAREVAAAVGAALANVVAHAGESARAWVLLEHAGPDVVVSVRDDGQGFDAGRLDQARADGRLGVVASIEGRARDLGGTASIESTPGAGTEVELRIPVAG
jgi:signal transduction histidine kinase